MSAMNFGTTVNAERFARYINAWEASALPRPNCFITINLTPGVYLRRLARPNLSWTMVFGKEIELIKRKVEKSGHRWLAVYVLDSRPAWHVHILCWIPDDCQALVLRHLARRYDVKATTIHSPLQLVCKRHSGLDVNFTLATDSRDYEGNCGWKGLAKYMSRHIDKTASGRFKDGGDLVRASHPIAQEVHIQAKPWLAKRRHLPTTPKAMGTGAIP